MTVFRRNGYIVFDNFDEFWNSHVYRINPNLFLKILKTLFFIDSYCSCYTPRAWLYGKLHWSFQTRKPCLKSKNSIKGLAAFQKLDAFWNSDKDYIGNTLFLGEKHFKRLSLMPGPYSINCTLSQYLNNLYRTLLQYLNTSTKHWVTWYIWRNFTFYNCLNIIHFPNSQNNCIENKSYYQKLTCTETCIQRRIHCYICWLQCESISRLIYIKCGLTFGRDPFIRNMWLSVIRFLWAIEERWGMNGVNNCVS